MAIIEFTKQQWIMMILLSLTLLYMLIEYYEVKDYQMMCQDALDACGFQNTTQLNCDVCRMFCPSLRVGILK